MENTLKGYLRDYGNRPKKSLGQVFLIDRSIQEKILEMAELSPEDSVVEIGPGTGTLTRELLPRARRLIALEVSSNQQALLITFTATVFWVTPLPVSFCASFFTYSEAFTSFDSKTPISIFVSTVLTALASLVSFDLLFSTMAPSKAIMSICA